MTEFSVTLSACEILSLTLPNPDLSKTNINQRGLLALVGEGRVNLECKICRVSRSRQTGPCPMDIWNSQRCFPQRAFWPFVEAKRVPELSEGEHREALHRAHLHCRKHCFSGSHDSF